MKIDINGIEYHIHFQYGRYDGRRQTRCEIHSGQCTDSPYVTEICGARPKGVGFSWCNHLDEFVKATGRKIALARAMDQFYDTNTTLIKPLPRELRTLVWAAYLDMVHEAVRR